MSLYGSSNKPSSSKTNLIDYIDRDITIRFNSPNSHRIGVNELQSRQRKVSRWIDLFAEDPCNCSLMSMFLAYDNDFGVTDEVLSKLDQTILFNFVKTPGNRQWWHNVHKIIDTFRCHSYLVQLTEYLDHFSGDQVRALIPCPSIEVDYLHNIEFNDDSIPCYIALFDQLDLECKKSVIHKLVQFRFKLSSLMISYVKKTMFEFNDYDIDHISRQIAESFTVDDVKLLISKRNYLDHASVNSLLLVSDINIATILASRNKHKLYDYNFWDLHIGELTSKRTGEQIVERIDEVLDNDVILLDDSVLFPFLFFTLGGDSIGGLGITTLKKNVKITNEMWRRFLRYVWWDRGLFSQETMQNSLSCYLFRSSYAEIVDTIDALNIPPDHLCHQCVWGYYSTTFIRYVLTRVQNTEFELPFVVELFSEHKFNLGVYRVLAIHPNRFRYLKAITSLFITTFFNDIRRLKLKDILYIGAFSFSLGTSLAITSSVVTGLRLNGIGNVYTNAIADKIRESLSFLRFRQ